MELDNKVLRLSSISSQRYITSRIFYDINFSRKQIPDLYARLLLGREVASLRVLSKHIQSNG